MNTGQLVVSLFRARFGGGATDDPVTEMPVRRRAGLAEVVAGCHEDGVQVGVCVQPPGRLGHRLRAVGEV
jgi:hypothetical protein